MTAEESAPEPRDPDSGDREPRTGPLWRPDPLSSGWRRRDFQGGWPVSQDSGWQDPGGGDQTPGEQQNAGWMILGYLISGMAVYGGLGALIGWLMHMSWLFPVGMLLGLGAGIALVIFKYGRPGRAA